MRHLRQTLQTVQRLRPALARGHAGCSGHHHHPAESASASSSAAHSHSHSSSPAHPQSHAQAHSYSTSGKTLTSPPAAATSHAHAATASARGAASGAGGAGDAAAATAYCADLVKRLDPDAWLCSYFWPTREKEWWFAVRAFNLELHLVTTSTTQPAIAAMRFQFWRDALAAIYGNGKPVPQHPVAQALAEMRRHRPVMKYYLSQLIEVRAKNLSAPPAAPSLETYLAEHTIPSALLQGSLPLLVAPSDEGTTHVAHTLSHIAHLLSITSLLHSLAPSVHRKQLPIPSDVAAQHGITDEDVFRNGAAAEGFRDAVFTIATRGMDELITARTDLKKDGGKVVPAAAMPLFLAAVPAERFLKRLEDVDFDVFAPALAKHDWRLAPSIWWTYQSGKL